MQDKVTIGIVGAGFGSQVHVPAFRASPRCEVRAICAKRKERARDTAAKLNIPKSTDDWRELVADPDIQALALAVPPSVQAEIALAAARAGKHLFCEKPLALNANQAREIVAVSRQSGIVTAMDFIFPEIAAWQKARELVQSPAIGRIRHVALTWRVETFRYSQNWHPPGWKQRAAEGGGTLNNFASHTMHYLEWLFGRMENVCARLSPSNAEVEARADVWVEFAAGFPGAVSIAADAFLGPGHRLEVFGDAGTLVLENPAKDYARGFQLFLGTRSNPTLVPFVASGDDENSDGRVYPVSRIACRFVDAILGGKGSFPNLDDGLRVQELLDALRLANRTGSWQTPDSQ
jgi:predicted dehydrogenase